MSHDNPIQSGQELIVHHVSDRTRLPIICRHAAPLVDRGLNALRNDIICHAASHSPACGIAGRQKVQTVKDCIT